MPDHDPLDNFPEGLHVNALPASEVRRRGDRLRRRNTALATVGGVVAAAVFIGTPVALMSGNGEDVVQPAPPGPTQTEDGQQDWLTEIPADFPVTEGMTDEGEPTEGDLDALALCNTSYPTSRGTADSVTYFYSGDGESSATRVFQLWPDDAAAYQTIDRLEKAVQDCPQQPHPGGDSVIETRLVDFDTGGDASLTFVQQIVEDDGLVSQLTTVEVTQVGNAVLVDSSYGAAGGDQAIDIATQNLANRSAATRAEMCVFSADPCSTTEVSPDPDTTSSSAPASNGATIADGFPLSLGYPETNGDGSPVVASDTPGLESVQFCDETAWTPVGAANIVGTTYIGEAEDFRGRTLAAYESPDDAQAALASVTAALAVCPEQTSEDGGGSLFERVESNLGDESVAWTQRYRSPEGLTDTGLTVFHMVRVDGLVLAAFEYGEGGGSAETIALAVDRANDQAATLAERMRGL